MASTLDAAKEALRIFSARGARFLGAAVAFYALMSAAPLFVVVLHVVGAVFGKPKAESALWSGLGAWLTPDGVATIRGLTERLDHLEASGSVLGGALFRFLPETDVSWREAGRSGAVSTVLFAAGSVVVSLWLRHKRVADLYAGASAVVLAVVWVYCSAQVFFLGACFGAAMRARERHAK